MSFDLGAPVRTPPAPSTDPGSHCPPACLVVVVLPPGGRVLDASHCWWAVLWVSLSHHSFASIILLKCLFRITLLIKKKEFEINISWIWGSRLGICSNSGASSDFSVIWRWGQRFIKGCILGWYLGVQENINVQSFKCLEISRQILSQIKDMNTELSSVFCVLLSASWWVFTDTLLSISPWHKHVT